jgi:hypothetical protein
VTSMVDQVVMVWRRRLCGRYVNHPYVASDVGKTKKKQPLSPILLAKGNFETGVALQIADGYHRVCASHYTDEDTRIPVVLAPQY